MTESSVTVLVADDHPVVRAGIISIIKSQSLFSVVGEAASFTRLQAMIEQQAPDVIVLDLNGMGSPPLSMISHLRKMVPQCKLLIFSSSIDLAPELLTLGIAGYVAKEDVACDLVVAIRAIVNAQPFLSSVVHEYLSRTAAVRREQDFTPAEMRVFGLLAQNHGTVEIAGILDIDPRSVQNIITRLRRKTGCTQRTQLVDWYRRMIPSTSSPSTIPSHSSTDENDV